MRPSAVLVHVQNVEEALAWYERAFKGANAPLAEWIHMPKLFDS
ncbi:hypothetical protein [Marinomonas mediterranea]|nr:hypothetical protein [Marinomonas mediterranea]